MSIGVIILIIAFVYYLVFWVMLGLKDKTQQTDWNTINFDNMENRSCIIAAIGFVLLFIAYIMIIPTPKPGYDKWLNSVLFLRLFWKIFGCLFVSVASLIVTRIISVLLLKILK